MAHEGKAALSLVQVEGGRTVYVYAGARVPDNAVKEDVDRLVADGYLIKLDADEVDDPDGPGGAPAKSATKDEWVAFAIAQGDADAASKTKDQLIAEHYPAS